jgi:hypothetical protein
MGVVARLAASLISELRADAYRVLLPRATFAYRVSSFLQEEPQPGYQIDLRETWVLSALVDLRARMRAVDD